MAQFLCFWLYFTCNLHQFFFFLNVLQSCLLIFKFAFFELLFNCALLIFKFVAQNSIGLHFSSFGLLQVTRSGKKEFELKFSSMVILICFNPVKDAKNLESTKVFARKYGKSWVQIKYKQLVLNTKYSWVLLKRKFLIMFCSVCKSFLNFCQILWHFWFKSLDHNNICMIEILITVVTNWWTEQTTFLGQLSFNYRPT